MGYHNTSEWMDNSVFEQQGAVRYTRFKFDKVIRRLCDNTNKLTFGGLRKAYNSELCSLNDVKDCMVQEIKLPFLAIFLAYFIHRCIGSRCWKHGRDDVRRYS